MTDTQKKLVGEYLKEILNLASNNKVINLDIYHGYNNWYNLMGQIYIHENGESVSSQNQFEEWLRNRMKNSIGFVDENICIALSWPRFNWPEEAKDIVDTQNYEFSKTYDYMLVKIKWLINNFK